LLIPFPISLSEREANSIENHAELFQRVGMKIERLSLENIVVREVPELLRDSEIEPLIPPTSTRYFGTEDYRVALDQRRAGPA
jgi:DNA mismatch repair ATPase MutL